MDDHDAPSAEIRYVIENKSTHESDFEHLIAAIGGYQETIPYNIAHTTTLSEDEAADSVSVIFTRVAKGATHQGQVVDLSREMRRSVEERLPEARRDDIAKHFAETVIRGDFRVSAEEAKSDDIIDQEIEKA